jgi:hypothetical protein
LIFGVGDGLVTLRSTDSRALAACKNKASETIEQIARCPVKRLKVINLNADKSGIREILSQGFEENESVLELFAASEVPSFE